MPLDLHIRAGRVEVIQCNTDVPEESLDDLWNWLSAPERARADRLKIAEKRREVIVSRGVLRAVLGRVMGLDGRTLTFDVGPHGKPSCAGISFNLSHTRGRVLLAVGMNCEIGVDVELAWKGNRVLELAERYFSTPEREALRNLPAEDQVRGFYRIWTRKEAIIKATGRGIGMGLDSFSVPVGGMPIPTTVPVPGGPWELQEVEMEWPYVAALATSAAAELGLWTFPVELLQR